jgi:ABC-2 type transport system ATP-binding protein
MPERSEHGAAVRLVGLRHAYPVGLGLRRRESLHAIDLTVAAGLKLALVGPNGSGKSTLLRVLAGVERPSGGSVSVLGGSPEQAHVRARIGYLPEDSPFPRELRARDMLLLLAALRGVPRRTALARSPALLERVGLAVHARTPLAHFSRGMLRRFGLAQALVHEPDLVLLDEPTAGLDAEGFEVLAGLVDELAARRATLCISSHLVSDVQRHADRLAVLLDGRVAALGEPHDVLPEDGGMLALYRRLR